MILSRALPSLLLPVVVVASFSDVFGDPDSSCGSCLRSIYNSCDSLYGYSEGPTSGFSDCMCRSSLGEIPLCAANECFDVFQIQHINVNYNAWCLTYNADFRTGACALAGSDRNYFEEYTGAIYETACDLEEDSTATTPTGSGSTATAEADTPLSTTDSYSSSGSSGGSGSDSGSGSGGSSGSDPGSDPGSGSGGSSGYSSGAADSLGCCGHVALGFMIVVTLAIMLVV